MSTSSLSQEWGEDFDYSPDLVGNQPKNYKDLSTFGKAGFAQCYIEKEAHILLRFRDGNGQEFLACIQRDWKGDTRTEADSLPAKDSNKAFLVQRLANDLLRWGQRASGLYGSNGQEQTMFVDIIQPLQEIKEPISSLIWADTSDGFNRLLGRAVYHSNTRDFPVCGDTYYRELCFRGYGPLSTVSDHETAGEVIEGTPETMENVSSNQRDTVGNLWNVHDVVRYAASLHVSLDADGVWIDMPELAQDGLKLIEVMIGPITLR